MFIYNYGQLNKENRLLAILSFITKNTYLDMSVVKKLFFVMFLIIICPINLYAADNSILIRTSDTSEAVEIFKRELPNRYNMLINHGFDADTKIGNPFYYSFYNNDDGLDVYYFPIIKNGKITDYLEQSISKSGNYVGWSIGDIFSHADNLYVLSDGNIYSIVRDKNNYEFAVSDSGQAIKLYTEYPNENMEYEPFDIWRDTYTYVVDITEPIEGIDTSFIIPNTSEEIEIMDNARNNGGNTVLLSLNNAETEVINRNNRILVPLRYIAENLDCEVDWDGNTKTAYVYKNNNVVAFTIGKNRYSINGSLYDLDTAAEIYNDKTYIPLRAVGESLSIKVAYNSERKSILLGY